MAPPTLPGGSELVEPLPYACGVLAYFVFQIPGSPSVRFGVRRRRVAHMRSDLPARGCGPLHSDRAFVQRELCA